MPVDFANLYAPSSQHISSQKIVQFKLKTIADNSQTIKSQGRFNCFDAIRHFMNEFRQTSGGNYPWIGSHFCFHSVYHSIHQSCIPVNNTGLDTAGSILAAEPLLVDRFPTPGVD